MEPFTMMLGYGLIQSAMQLVVKPVADHLTRGSRQRELIEQMENKNHLDIDVLRLNKAIDYENTINIQEYSHRLRLDEANQQFNNQLEMWRLGRFNDTMWPLRTPFNDPSLRPVYLPNRPVPINIFLAKTDPRSAYAKLLQDEVKTKLSNFLQKYSHSSHPIICRIGDWKDGFQDDAFINALWYGLKGQPTIVINPVQTELGETLSLNVSSWGLAQDGYSPTIQQMLNGEYRTTIGRLIREETIRYLDSHSPIRSKEFDDNVNLLNDERKLLAKGSTQDDVARHLLLYRLAEETKMNVLGRFSTDFAIELAYITGMYADIYHLVEYGMPPRLPQAIREYNQQYGTNLALPQKVAEHYQKTLTCMACSDYHQDRLPQVYLGVAQAISDNREKAEEILREGVWLWANRKTDGQSINPPETVDECVRLIQDKADGRDMTFVSHFQTTVQAFGKQVIGGDIAIQRLPRPQLSFDFKCVKYANWKEFLYKTRENSLGKSNHSCFSYFILSNHIVVGVYCDNRGNPEMTNGTKNVSVYIIILYGAVKYNEKQHFYRITDFVQGISQEDQYSEILSSLSSYLAEHNTLDEYQPILANYINTFSQSNEALNRIVFLFDDIIASQRIVKYSMNDILLWTKANHTEENQLYLVKGFHNKSGCYILCVMFANDGEPLLDVNDKKTCYLSHAIPSDIEEFFKGKSIYILPIKNK